MPFALVAVVLLVLTSYSVVVLAEAERAGAELEASETVLRTLEDAAGETADHVRATSLAVLHSISREGGRLEPEELQTLFQQRLDEALEHSYPREEAGVLRTIDGHGIAARTVFLSLSPGEPHAASLPSYAKVVGTVEVNVSADGAELGRKLPVDAEAPVPLPLLSGLLGDHSSILEGSRSELGRLMAYQLGSLAQMRALSGASAVGSTERLLEDEDARRSLDSSLDILERGSFRSHAGDSSLPAEASLLDAAELFLPGEALEIDLNELLAQSLYAIVDLTVLRWMEYLDLIRLPIDLFDRAVHDISHVVETFATALGDGPPAATYLEERMADAGHRPDEYRHLHTGGVAALHLPPLRASLAGGTTVEGGTVTVEVPEVDIFDSEGWEAFMPIYREGLSGLSNRLQNIMKDAAAHAAASHELPTVSVAADPYDDVPFSQALAEAVEEAMPMAKQALNSAVEMSVRESASADPMGLELASYLEEYRTSLLREDAAYEAMLEAATEHYFDGLLRSDAAEGFADPDAMRALRSDVEMSMIRAGTHSHIWDESRAAGDASIELINRVLRSEGGGPGALSRTLGDLASGAIEGVPAIADEVLSSMLSVAESMAEGSGLSTGKGVELMHGEGMRLHDSKGGVHLQDLEVEREGEGDIDVRVLAPEDVRGGAVRYIGLDHWSMAPYMSTAIVRVQGEILYTLSTAEGDGPLPVSEASETVKLDLEVRVPVHTAWPLQGVEYRNSNTLGSDMAATVLRSAMPMMEHLRGAFSACDSVFAFVAEAGMKLNSYATDSMLAVTKAVMGPVLALQEALEEGFSSVMMHLFEGFLDDAGNIKLSTDIFGMRLDLETNPLEMALGQTRDLLRMTLSVNISDVHLSASLRLLRMDAGDYYVLGTGNMGMNDWYVSLTIDPSMRVYRHLVEVKGNVGDHGFQMNFPQIRQYETFSLRLSQVPAVAPFISSIPLPFPGMRGSVDAGMELKYDIPQATNVVINEVETNPPGPDSGREWIELFNPLNKEVDISGWTVSTGYGNGRHHQLPAIALGPGEFHVHVFPVRTLYNGDGLALPRGESVMLWNADGAMVDSTPWIVDTDDDSRTWQREYDGSDRWVFAEGTRGESNGPRTAAADLGQWFVSELRESALTAMTRMTKSDADMTIFADFLHETIEILIDRVMKRLASCIVEMKLFIYLGVSDLTSSLEGGMELSLVAGRDFALEGLRWILGSVKGAVDDILNPGNGHREGADFLLEESHLRLSFVSSMGPPGFVGRLSDNDRYEVRAMVQMNLAALASLGGMARDDKRIGFGVLISGVPGNLLPPMFRADPGSPADVWIMKGSITY